MSLVDASSQSFSLPQQQEIDKEINNNFFNNKFFIDNSFIYNDKSSNNFINYINKESSNNESFNNESFNKKELRFDIWALYKLHSLFFDEIRNYNFHPDLTKNIINWERTKLKICRYVLDSKYIYRVIYDDANVFIHHLWNNYLFDVDCFSLETNDIICKQSMEYTLANIFDMILANLVNGNLSLNDNINAIIMNTYANARFNLTYFRYLSDNCKNKEFVDRVNARIVLSNLL